MLEGFGVHTQAPMAMSCAQHPRNYRLGEVGANAKTLLKLR
jgi:hypothetical protein